MFKDNEQQPNGFTLPLAQALDHLRWNEAGLVPAIARQHDTGEVLMMAWMNREALEDTLRTGRVCYYSRSRGGLWRKGESSGQTQTLIELRIDCDGDTVLVNVDQTGPACHTGRRDCFYWRADGEQLVLDKAPLIDPADLYPDKH
ncbi:phosphoribosyl-AMP cyclohydrolase [Alcanivorax sp. S71-1-4]|uniref:phosphoribosyl-AMP cyclohydrolase n=1 Tax=Alcanivorax sp. S71-1-4 TaxID=1177159 RepID=UPI00135B3A46|nr:phosphoribosyl-AMP cyclohydrolase [Alcanivorax sp. S71-1-4]KAF0810703.1 phosphoribosyl-AMP cyclohydrolase [Alcanivorax sp. S71-1-4]